MLRKPINLITYILACIFFGYAMGHGVFYLIVSIALLFHSFMSCDTIDIGRRP